MEQQIPQENVTEEAVEEKKLQMPRLLVPALLVVGVVGILFISFSSSGTEQMYEGKEEQLRVAAYEGDSGLLIYLAEEKGFFKEQGLDVIISDHESGKQAADTLLAGGADISTSADAVLVANSFIEKGLRTFGTVAVAKSNGLIARKDRSIFSLEDLRGKKVGVTKKSTGEFNLGIFLLIAGLSLEDIEVVDLPPSDLVKGIVSGELDAIMTWEPNLYEASRLLPGNTNLFKEGIDDFYFLLLADRTWLSENPKIAKRFLKALIAAEEYVQKNEKETTSYMERTFGYTKAYANTSIENHRFTIRLPQSMLISLEDQAIWRIENGLNEFPVPNYLDFIDSKPLTSVDANKVTIIQ